MEAYTVGQVSDLLQVSSATVRRWAGLFASHLSSGANPGTGQERQFVADDVRVFAHVKRRLEKGAGVRIVEEELATATLPTWAEIVGERDVIADSTDVQALAFTGERMFDVIRVSVATQERIAGTLDQLHGSAVDLAAIRAELAELRLQVEALTHQVEELARESHRHAGTFPWRAQRESR